MLLGRLLIERSASSEDSFSDEDHSVNGFLVEPLELAVSCPRSREPLLCLHCANSLLRRDALKDIMRFGIIFARSPTYLKAAAHSCCMCSIFYKLIIQRRWKFLTKLPSLTLTLGGEQPHKVGGHSTLFSIDMYQHGRISFWATRAYGWFPTGVITTASANQPTDDRGKPLYGYAEKHKLEIASDLLKDCVTNHEDCPRITATPLPTRVLDIGTQDLGLDIRLFESQGASARYAALTYCWGVKQDQALVKSRFLQYCERIRLPSLPKTIQEAVQTARVLGVRYLWIDAYCIIQDCDEDMAREVSNMHRIYENSFFTVAAAGAPDATVGFLNLEPQSEVQKLPLMLWNGRLATFFIQPSTRNNVVDQPINRRAWTLQECLLSPRLIWFESGRSALEWHCKTVQQDERGLLDAVPHFHSFDSRLLQKAFNLYHEQAYADKIPVHRLCYKWSAIVQEFSQRSLSNPSDKLSALAGVAAVFHKIWGGSYYAGIWSQYIFQQLLWSFNPTFSDPETYPRPAPQYRAPSWSWASIDGKLSMPQFPYLETHGLEFVSCDITLADAANPFGPILDGQLRLRGMVKEGYIARDLFDLSCTEPSLSTRIGSISLDSMELRKQTLPKIWCLAVEKPCHEFEIDSDSGSAFSQQSCDPPGSWGGLLMVMKGEKDGGEPIFVRIGTFTLFLQDWFDNCTPRFLTVV